jgi:hypothetical protein
VHGRRVLDRSATLDFRLQKQGLTTDERAFSELLFLFTIRSALNPSSIVARLVLGEGIDSIER